MELLLDEDATGYCVGSPARRAELWTRASASASCPALVLPIFEVCRAIHFGARAGTRLEIDRFRACWRDLVHVHEEQSAALGARLRLLDGGEGESDNLPRAVWSRSRVASIAEGTGEQRPDTRDRRPLREAFRAIGRAALDFVADEEEWKRQWDHPVLDLPGRDWLSASRGSNLVLDTNFFVELLDELPQHGAPERLPCRTGRPARSLGEEQRRFERAIDRRGLEGRLVVPAVVLIETYGIVRVHGARSGTYRNADRVMEALAIAGDDWALWNVFQFEPLSLDVLDAFLGLHEALVRGEPDRGRWPDFGDALVLAHGLLHRCPVVSGEWVDKNDWAAVRRLFPYLVP